MSQQNTPVELPAYSELPLKRKRGRPRKEDTSPQQEHIFKTPASERMKQIQDGIVESEDEAENEMVGQTISGVVDGKFDAGYLLTVRLENDDTLLHGVVFKPEHVLPITPSNDVAPNVRMHRRREIPFPVPNVQTNQINSIVQQCLQEEKLPFQLEKQELTVEDQSASVAPVGLNINMEQDGCSGTMITEVPKIHKVGYKESLIEPSSEPRVSMFLGNETIDLVPINRAQPKDCVADLNELKRPTQSHVVVQCNTSTLPEVISMQIDIPTESYASPKNSIQQEMMSDVAFKVSSDAGSAVMNDSSFPSEVKNGLSVTNFPIAADTPSGSYTSLKKGTKQEIQSAIALKISSGGIVAVNLNDSSSLPNVMNESSVMNFPVAADIPSGGWHSPKKSTQQETEPDIALKISSGQVVADDMNDSSFPSQVQRSTAVPVMNTEVADEKFEQRVIEPHSSNLVGPARDIDSSVPSEVKNDVSGTNTGAAAEESEERVTGTQNLNLANEMDGDTDETTPT